LAIEDLHWIDKTSEECISYLIDWLANKRILLILIYRLEYTHQWGSKSYYTKIGLTQLGSDSSNQLVQAILEGGEVVPELRELVLGRSGGNPLFVEELTHSLLENGTIQKKNHQYVLTRSASDIHVPDTIQGIIAARIDRIEESLKRVMQVASVIGREFAFRILQAIMGMEEELKSYLLNLQGLELIAEKRLFPELDYIFKHALTQEVAYNSLLQKRRREIHEKIGEAIELLYPNRLEEYFELLAYHYSRSDDASKALDYLDRANQKSVKLNAMEEAKSYFDEAMKLLDNQPETESTHQRRISLLVNQWIVFWLLFRVPEYFELLKEHEPIAVKVADPKLLSAFYARLGMCKWVSGHLEESIKTLTKAAEICEDPENVEEVSFRNMYLIWNYLYKGDYDQAIAFKNVVVRLMEQKFNLRTYTWSLCGVSWAYSCLSRYDEALNLAHKTLKVSEEYLNNGLISFAAFIISIAHLYKGEYDRSVEYGDLAVQKAPTIAEKVWAQSFYGWSLCRAGKALQGVELLASLVPMFRATGFLPGEIVLTLHLCEGYWLSGEYSKAKQTLEEVLPLAERCGMKLCIAWAHRLLGEVALKTDFERMEPHFEKSIALCEKIKAENELAQAYSGYGRFHKQVKNITQARKYLMKALEIFERLGVLIEPDKIRKELVDLPGV
jgi:tetratricopeptide (TPR) repeat protein